MTGGALSSAFLKEHLSKYHFDQVYGVDKGINVLWTCRFMPHAILGDFDSCDQEVLQYYKDQGVPIKTFQSEKDMTDTQLAVDAIIKDLKASFDKYEVHLLGASGSRLDHTVINMQLLELYSNERIHLYDSSNHLYHVKAGVHTRIQKETYNYVSILPLSKKVEGVTIQGVKYPLDQAVLKRGDSFSISNEIVDEVATFYYKKGSVLILLSKD